MLENATSLESPVTAIDYDNDHDMITMLDVLQTNGVDAATAANYAASLSKQTTIQRHA